MLTTCQLYHSYGYSVIRTETVIRTKTVIAETLSFVRILCHSYGDSVIRTDTLSFVRRLRHSHGDYIVRTETLPFVRRLYHSYGDSVIRTETPSFVRRLRHSYGDSVIRTETPSFVRRLRHSYGDSVIRTETPSFRSRCHPHHLTDTFVNNFAQYSVKSVKHDRVSISVFEVPALQSSSSYCKLLLVNQSSIRSESKIVIFILDLCCSGLFLVPRSITN